MNQPIIYQTLEAAANVTTREGNPYHAQFVPYMNASGHLLLQGPINAQTITDQYVMAYMLMANPTLREMFLTGSEITSFQNAVHKALKLYNEAAQPPASQAQAIRNRIGQVIRNWPS